MATKANAAKREAGKISAEKDDVITAELGTIWLTMEKNKGNKGKCYIGFTTDLVGSVLNRLCDFANDTLDIVLEPDRMFGDCTGEYFEEVDKTAYDAIRKWIANNTELRFSRSVDDTDLIDDQQ